MMQIKRLQYLINYLLEELGDKVMPLPNNKDELFDLYRMLVNIRKPQKISIDFIKIQDEMLQEELNQTLINDVSCFDSGITLWQGDITKLKVDAIVNAANNQLLGCFIPNHHCIDNAIHTYAGVQLREACNKLMEEQKYLESTGRAKITKAYNLPSKYVIHTVGPIVHEQVSDKEKLLLASCYYHCLKIADKYQLKSIAFCCISTGEFKFPNQLAAEIALKQVREYLSQNSTSLEKIVINVFKDEDYIIYQKLLNEL